MIGKSEGCASPSQSTCAFAAALSSHYFGVYIRKETEIPLEMSKQFLEFYEVPKKQPCQFINTEVSTT